MFINGTSETAANAKIRVEGGDEAFAVQKISVRVGSGGSLHGRPPLFLSLSPPLPYFFLPFSLNASALFRGNPEGKKGFSQTFQGRGARTGG